MLFRLVLVLGLWASVSFPAVAQEMPSWAAPQELTDDPPPPSAPSPPGDPSPVPVDGGLALLALAGAGYAAHRLRRR